jgi:trehalose synthase
MPATLADYQEIVGESVIDELRIVAERVRSRSMQHINSTAVGGGVAEILTRLVPLMNELGIHSTWDVIKGEQAFFNVTKAFHNALHGKQEEITENMFDIFRATTEANLRDVNLHGGGRRADDRGVDRARPQRPTGSA